MGGFEHLLSIFAFLWGAIWGSFLNVVIHRLPRGESLLTPPSHCPSCGKRIRWYHNIPIVSYLAIAGRCAYCRQPVSVRYPMVELVAATMSLAVWQRVAYDPYIPDLAMAGTVFIFYFAFVMALLAITFIDLEHLIIPDAISLPGTVVGVVFHSVVGQYTQVGWLESVVGAVSGAGIITLFILGYFLVTRRVGMGWGDAKLMAFVGAFLGWKSLPFVLIAGSVQGIIYALISIPARKRGEGGLRRAHIPFGPFLSLAALEWLFFSFWIEAFFSRFFRL